MKKVIFSLLIVFASILSSCSNGVPEVSQSPSQSTLPLEENESKPSFNISSFSMDYTKDGAGIRQEEYEGEGIITLNGSPDILNKVYYVFVELKKLSGGTNSSGATIQTVIVTNGIGKFSTYDWNLDENIKLQKPVYEAKIIGYIEANNYNMEAVKSQ